MAATSRWALIQHRPGRQALPAGRDSAVLPRSGSLLEAYGPGGTAILVECLPEAGAAVRETLARHHASPGAQGALSYLFNQVGLLSYGAAGSQRDQIQAVALSAGAEDVVTAPDGSLEVLTAPADLEAVQAALVAAGHEPSVAGVVYRSEAAVAVPPAEAAELLALLEALADIPGVGDVWCNGSLPP